MSRTASSIACRSPAPGRAGVASEKFSYADVTDTTVVNSAIGFKAGIRRLDRALPLHRHGATTIGLLIDPNAYAVLQRRQQPHSPQQLQYLRRRAHRRRRSSDLATHRRGGLGVRAEGLFRFRRDARPLARRPFAPDRRHATREAAAVMIRLDEVSKSFGGVRAVDRRHADDRSRPHDAR